MLSIVCWKWKPLPGAPNTKKYGKYTAHHVNALYEMLKKHTSFPFNMICVTDEPHGIYNDIRIVPLWNEFRSKGGCFTRLVCFKRHFKEFGHRFVSFDLDCVILKNIDSVLSREGDFVIWSPDVHDYSRRSASYCGSLWALTAGAKPEVYETFNPNDYNVNSKGRYTGGSDQQHISKTLPDAQLFTSADGIYNFMPDIHPVGKELPDDARIVFFNGRYLPDDKGIAKLYPWVQKHYPRAGHGEEKYIPAYLSRRARPMRQVERIKKYDVIREPIKTDKDHLKNCKTINMIAHWWNDWPNENEKIGKQYVQRWYDGIKRNLPDDGRKYKIILFTDKEDVGVNDLIIKKVELQEPLRWNLRKMFMYSHEAGLAYPTICFDLDLIIASNLRPIIDAFAKVDPNALVTCRGAYSSKAIGGSIIGFHPKKDWSDLLWEPLFTDKEEIERKTKGSERNYYKQQLPDDRINFWEQYLPERTIASFKQDCKYGIPSNAVIVRFHGYPRPHEVITGWIARYWKGVKIIRKSKRLS